MNFQEWVEKYKPHRNERGEIIAYETYGEYIEFLAKQDPQKIWTLIDDGENSEIVASFRVVNRLNYFITDEKWENKFEYVALSPDNIYDILYTA